METTTNAFQGGLKMDISPLSQSSNTLTDALNATYITYNGLEAIILNDLGNSPILDGKTGATIELSEGFIPIGIKEYGGVVYVASCHPDGRGELGSFPSPYITYSLKLNILQKNSKHLIKDDAPSDTSIYEVLNHNINEGLIKITSNPLRTGDKFLIILDLDLTDTKLSYIIKKLNNGNLIEREYPLFSNSVDLKAGFYTIELYIIPENRQPILLSDLQVLKYYTTTGELKESKNWFITKSELNNDEIDANLTNSANLFKIYPRCVEGYLAIKVVPNLYKDLKIIGNSPYTFIEYEKQV